MKRFLLSAIIVFQWFLLFSQYKLSNNLATPDWATLVRCCSGSSSIENIKEFENGEIIVRGETQSQPGKTMVIGENTQNAITLNTQNGQDNYGGYLAKFNNQGTPVWAKYMDNWFIVDDIYKEPASDKLYIAISPKSPTGIIRYDQTDYTINSSYTAQLCLIVKYSTGEFIKLLSFPQASKYIFSQGKKIVLFSPINQYSPYYHPNLLEKVGFLNENDSIYKYQTKFNNLIGNTQTYWSYNKFRNTWWFMGITKPREIRLSGDSLIVSSREFNLPNLPEIEFIETVPKFLFLSENEIIINCTSNNNAYNNLQKILIKCDTSGNFIWMLKFHQANQSNKSTFAIDKNGDIWAQLCSSSYYDTITLFPSKKSWLISDRGNMGIYELSKIIKIDHTTGEPILGLINGYGSRNYDSLGLSIHISGSNLLYVPSSFYSFIMFPDKSGNYYYSIFSDRCGMMPESQVILSRYSLDGLIYRSLTPSVIEEYEKYQSSRLKIFPNPSSGHFVIEYDQIATFYLMDINGKLITTIETKEPLTEINLELERGIYLLKNRETHLIQKIVIQ